MSRIEVICKLSSVEDILKRRDLEEGGRCQQYIDSEIIRRMPPYMPKASGDMIKSMPRASVPGSGEVIVNTAYAYMRNKIAREREDDGFMRGPRYFARMKADHRRDILERAGRLAGVEVKD